ncbi:hypothetical protein MMC25_002822 [Agyrium rufum]|nr:hypothetical protein [Agyrium rufum]
MSASPPKEMDVEPAGAAQSPDTADQMDKADEALARDLAFEFDVKEQDRWLPIANALPDNAKIAKEAKECMQECVSEFISFITSEASEKCQQEKRKTVNGEDILFAMTSLGFENYADALKIYLIKYRETLQSRGEQQNQNRPSSSYGQQGAQSSSATSSNAMGVTGVGPSAIGASSVYPSQPDASTASLMGADLGDPSQQSNPFASIYPPGATHNTHPGGNAGQYGP